MVIVDEGFTVAVQNLEVAPKVARNGECPVELNLPPVLSATPQRMTTYGGEEMAACSVDNRGLGPANVVGDGRVFIFLYPEVRYHGRSKTTHLPRSKPACATTRFQLRESGKARPLDWWLNADAQHPGFEAQKREIRSEVQD